MSNGLVDFGNGNFIVTAGPHILMRMKRVFGKVDMRQHGRILMSASDEAARDLEWFLERYPMEIAPAAAPSLVERATRHKDRERTVAQILAGHQEIADFGLALPLREYQQVAAEVAYQRRALLLADDVGLGKTASAIGLLARSQTLPALVVTLTHLPKQWQAELGRFAPHLSSHIVTTGKPYDIVKRHASGKRGPQAFPDVLIISYSKLSTWADALAPLVRCVVFDEVQELRRSESKRWAAASHIASHCYWRMGLSATPIYNYGAEMWNVLEAIEPGACGTFEEFTNEWCSWAYDAKKARIENPAAFGQHMRESGLMLRRTRKDVGRELKQLAPFVQHVDANLNALDRVSADCAELARAILSGGEQFRGQKMQQSEEFSNRLRQATGIAKAPFVAEFARILLEGEQRIVLYGWHREVYSIWMDALREFNPVLYTGTESPTQKEAAKESFISGISRILIISLRSGAGLDGLQKVCRTVVFGELDWSPGVHEQCIGRVERDGQEDEVFKYFLVSDAGADPTMAEVLGLKQQQIQGIRNDKQDELFSRPQNDGGHVKRLAEEFLRIHSDSTRKVSA